jgi:NitT/TauT family transport system permease protein
MRFASCMLQAVVGMALLLGAWWAGTALLKVGQARSYVLPGPDAVARKVMDLIATDAFMQHVWASLSVLAYGLVPAVLVGVGIGTAAGITQTGRWILGSLVVMLAACPLVALFPVLIMWQGVGTTANAIMVFIASTFAVANVVMIRWPGSSMGGARATGVSHGKATAMVAALRIGLLYGVIALVVAEFTTSRNGLAYYVLMSMQMLDTTQSLAAVLILLVPTAIVGIILQATEEQLAT